MNISQLTEQATAIHEDLAEEIYYGLNFKLALMENPELMVEIRALLDEAKKARNA